MPRLEFWYEFASNYSYLSVMRISDLAQQAGVEVIWRPIPARADFQVARLGYLAFQSVPGERPLHDPRYAAVGRKPRPPFRHAAHVPSQRVEGGASRSDWCRRRLDRAVHPRDFEAEFGRGEDIAQPAVIEKALSGLGLDSASLLARAEEPEIKQRLKDQTAEASSRGIFGAPSFITEDGELFWGDDRLEQALAWAAGSRQK